MINNDTQIIAICSDITRIKEVELQSQRLRSSLFSSVAHELRTPLNSIIPIIKMILEFFPGNFIDEARLVQYLKIVLNSSIHLQNVIEDALDFSRLENNKFQIFKEFFDPKKAIEEVCEIMKFQIEQKNLLLKVQYSGRLPHRIYSDVKRLKQVLFNLIGNAVKFTFKGYIAVSFKYDPELSILTASVEDSGIGIQPNDLNKLFKFFGCLAASKTINQCGMGLGLTISKMIIHQLGGQISVTSLPGQGSNFTFTIPLKENS